MIERAQFAHNKIIYLNATHGGLLGRNTRPPFEIESNPFLKQENRKELSFLEYMLIGTETLHATVRRYTSPEEHAFYPMYLPSPLPDLNTLNFPSELLSDLNNASSINMNSELLDKYVSFIVPEICEKGDDEQHGSSVLCDVAILQALSKRIHFGKFVAESKFRNDPDSYKRLVAINDRAGVMALLTDSSVERKVLRRAAMKCATYGREPILSDFEAGLKKQVGFANKDNKTSEELTTIIAAAAAAAAVVAVEGLTGSASDGSSSKSSEEGVLKVNPNAIEKIYKDVIIPMTKEVEVEYLFRRCKEKPFKGANLSCNN